MWMDEETTQPELASQTSVPSLALGAEQSSMGALIGGLSSVINTHKNNIGMPTPFHMVDMKLGDGELASGLVSGYRNRNGGAGSRPIIVSGIDMNPESIEGARERLAGAGVLGQVHALDAASTPSANIRNRLECVGGGDLVLLSHAAYPSHLPAFKLPRMVDRLSDMVAPYGAVVTVHNHGASDVDAIRSKALGLPNFAAPGLRCDTHPRLEQAFGGGKLHAFSVTVPNIIKLPANAKAVAAIFSGHEAGLTGGDAQDAAKIRNVLELVAGGAEILNAAIAEMDEEGRARAGHLFGEKIAAAKDGEMSITDGGGQMVMAFRDLGLARDAFTSIQQEAKAMTPPALALPISQGVAPGFDKAAAHQEWKASLASDHGIANPPAAPQASAAASRLR